MAPRTNFLLNAFDFYDRIKITHENHVHAFLTTCLHPYASSKRIELGPPARSHLKDLLQSFKMVMDFAMFFSLLGCETLTNKLFAFLFCHSYID